MTATRYSLPILFLLTLLSVQGCGKKEQGEKTQQPPVLSGIQVATLSSSAIAETMEATGTVRARSSAPLSARIAGTVTSVPVREGDRVTAGRLLATIEATEAEAGSAGAEAGLTEARQGLEEAMARKRLADNTFERFRKLAEEQAITRQELDMRRADKEVADQGVARAEARLAQARELARSAGVIAGYGKVTAPLAGIVTGKKVEKGMTVFPGTPLMTIEAEGAYRLEAEAPESLAGALRTGQPVRVVIDGAALEVNGRIGEISPTADPATRTLTVKIDLAGKGLRSGMFGRAIFPQGERKGILAPRNALVERGALTSVWVVDTKKTARMRLVKAGRTVGGQMEILSGLNEGERIIVGGVEQVSEGARIE